jgi:methionyl-tRNA synthetase
LRDRALTRDLDWGIDVPKEGYEEKKIYIWAENVLGYLSASEQAARLRGTDFAALWGADAKHYYVHGKDNIPFHTIILPALLLAQGRGCACRMKSSQAKYMTLEGRKISTIRNWVGVWRRSLLICTIRTQSATTFLAKRGRKAADCGYHIQIRLYTANNGNCSRLREFFYRTLTHRPLFGQKGPEGVRTAKLRKKLAVALIWPGNGSSREAADALEAVI